MKKPSAYEVLAPWVAEDCDEGDLDGHKYCTKCDGAGWYYRNKETGHVISEFMRSAMERHG